MPECIVGLCPGFDALKDQIEDELSGLEAWADQQEDYVDFDPADYVDNPVALARMKAQVKQVDLARHMQVTQSYISKLEHADQVSDGALQKPRGTKHVILESFAHLKYCSMVRLQLEYFTMMVLWRGSVWF